MRLRPCRARHDRRRRRISILNKYFLHRRRSRHLTTELCLPWLRLLHQFRLPVPHNSNGQGLQPRRRHLRPGLSWASQVFRCLPFHPWRNLQRTTHRFRRARVLLCPLTFFLNLSRFPRQVLECGVRIRSCRRPRSQCHSIRVLREVALSGPQLIRRLLLRDPSWARFRVLLLNRSAQFYNLPVSHPLLGGSRSQQRLTPRLPKREQESLVAHSPERVRHRDVHRP